MHAYWALGEMKLRARKGLIQRLPEPLRKLLGGDRVAVWMPTGGESLERRNKVSARPDSPPPTLAFTASRRTLLA